MLSNFYNTPLITQVTPLSVGGHEHQEMKIIGGHLKDWLPQMGSQKCNYGIILTSNFVGKKHIFWIVLVNIYVCLCHPGVYSLIFSSFLTFFLGHFAL